MNFYLLIVCECILLFIAGNAFYIAFKKYDGADDFTFNGLTSIEFLFSVLVYLSEKMASAKAQVFVFKSLAFLFGLFFLGAAILTWILFR
ncbi:MAG: hypothetical protein KBT36_06065 [Kurthia sp.]|nr:hypothetical protein [Candidatus Kurthia equi]